MSCIIGSGLLSYLVASCPLRCPLCFILLGIGFPVSSFFITSISFTSEPDPLVRPDPHFVLHVCAVACNFGADSNALLEDRDDISVEVVEILVVVVSCQYDGFFDYQTVALGVLDLVDELV